MAAEHNEQNQSEDGSRDASSFYDQQLFERVRSIKEGEQDQIDEMDASIARIQDELESLKTALETLPEQERRLMTVLVARSIKRSLREILLEQSGATD